MDDDHAGMRSHPVGDDQVRSLERLGFHGSGLAGSVAATMLPPVAAKDRDRELLAESAEDYDRPGPRDGRVPPARRREGRPGEQLRPPRFIWFIIQPDATGG